MSFDRIRAAGQWLANLVIQPSEMEQLDENLSNALDGNLGGAYSTTFPLVVGGAGIQDANAVVNTISVASGTSTWTAQSGNRIHFSGGANVNTKFVVRLTDSADGTHRIVSFDSVKGGVILEFQNASAAVVGSITMPEPATGVRVVLERISSAWVLTHYGQNFVSNSFASIAATSLPNYGSSGTLLEVGSLNVVGLVSGQKVFALPTYVANGQRRRVRFDGVAAGGATLSFALSTSAAAPFYDYKVGATGARDFTLVWEKTGSSTWELVGVECSHDARRHNTYVNNQLGTILVDPNLYGQMRMNLSLYPGRTSYVRMMPPLSEGISFTVWYNECRLTSGSAISFAQVDANNPNDPANTNGFFIAPGGYIFDARKNPQSGGETGGESVSFEFQAIDGAWRYMGMRM